MRSRIAESFYQNAEKAPDKLAVWCDGKTVTYSEMATMVSRHTRLLMDLGARYGDHIAIPINSSIESVALFFSAADLGVCLVPINPTLPFEAIQTAMQTSNAKHLIARKSFLRECAKKGGLTVNGFTLCLNGETEGATPLSHILQMEASRPDTPHITGNESFILTMTSGSTGSPKPIDISQKNKCDRVAAHVQVYGITEADRILAATPLYHSLAERLVILPLMIGATSILLPRFTPKLWTACVAENQVTFTIAVSAQLAQILELMNQDANISIESFRAIVSSSALLETHVKEALIEKLHCELHEMYGTSETSTATSICFQQVQHKQASVGLPFGNAKLRILDTNGKECLTGEVGEIAISSPLTCKGYYNQPKMMADATKDGFFCTGDLGYLDQEGYLYFSGRKKELIITGAVNVYPNDIDVVVGKMEGVAECAAFSYPDSRLGEVVALAVVKKEGVELTSRCIQMYCARHLADFQQPHKIFFLDSLPKNAMGKLQRMKILELI